MLKPTIISISMATVMAGAAISPALGVIAEYFAEASQTTIKLILTAPALTIIPFTFITSFLTSKLRKKTIVLIGLATYLIGGIAPQFMMSIESIIFFRLVLGASVGILMPLSESLIYDYFVGDERTQMMGFNQAFSNLGGIVTMLIAGWLASYGWRLPFNVYLLGVVIFILVFYFLPEGEPVKVPPTTEKSRIPGVVYGYALAMGLLMLAYYSVATNMALFLEETGMGGPVLAGTIVSAAAAGGVITSLFLVKFMKFFKKHFIPLNLLIMGGAFYLLANAASIGVVMLGAALVGLAQGALFPILTMKALNSVKLHQTDRAIAIATTFIFAGQFASPLVLDSLSKLFGKTLISFQFFILAVMLLVGGLGTTVVLRDKEYVSVSNEETS